MIDDDLPTKECCSTYSLNGDILPMVKQDRLEMTQPGIPNSGLAGGFHTNLSASWRMMVP